MLSLGGAIARTCGGLSRRSFLKVGTLGPLGLTLADLFRLREARGAAEGTGEPRGPARSVIFLWLWGGPSHLDTFDMKPDAPIEYRGPFSPIDTVVPGIQICELFPSLARCADRFAILRTLHHDEVDHGVAGTMGLTGSRSGGASLGGDSVAGAALPSYGAIASRLHDRPAGALPPYIVLGAPLEQGRKRVVGEGGGVLGSPYDPFRLSYELGEGIKLPEVELPPGISSQRMTARWELLQRLGSGGFGEARPSAGAVVRMDRHYELAHRLIASRESLKALDLESEPPSVRERYGPHRFGQCCLIARRLVEAGIPFVQVNWSSCVEPVEDHGDGGWDMHDRYFAIMQEQHGWMFDRAASALLEDLDQRGLLDSTLVVAVGEFGRSPKINHKAGREHHSQCYSALLAGGGIQGGRVVGQSDGRGEHPVDAAYSPADLGTTILAQLGIGTSQLTSINLTPIGEVIRELL